MTQPEPGPHLPAGWTIPRRQEQLSLSSPTPFIQTTKTYHQLNLHNENQSLTDNEEWGDPQHAPSPGVLRVGFQNIGPQRESSWSSHSKATTAHLAKGHYDAFLFVDYGLHFGKVVPEHHWRERVKPIYKNSSSVLAYNTNETQLLCSPFQAGGSGLTLGDDLNSRRTDSGLDPTGLGRWAWTKITGKSGFETLLISSYRPNNNRRDSGSVWHQHRRYFLTQGDDRDPIVAYDQDILHCLQGWLDAGLHIILGIDANEDVRNGTLARQLLTLGLQEAVTTRHRHNSPPATQNRNRSRTPIDGLWTSRSLEVVKAGYLAFGGGCPSDHRALWIDVSTSSILGHRPPRLLKPVAHRLNSADPRLWRRYCTRVVSGYEEHHIPAKIRRLKHLRSSQSPHDSLLLETLHHEVQTTTRRIRQDTANHIKKVCRGEVPWSPRLQRFRDTIELWTRVVKQQEGYATSRTIIRRLAHKCGQIEEVTTCNPVTALAALKQAHQAYKAAKVDSPLWRNEHLIGLADALAASNNSSRARELKKMLTVERQRQQGRAARRLRGRTPKQPVTKVTYVGDEGQVVEACDPAAIASVCARSNLRRQHRCLETPFLQNPLLHELGYLADTVAAESILQGSFEPPANIDKYTRAFLRELAIPKALQQLGPINIAMQCLRGRTVRSKRISF